MGAATSADNNVTTIGIEEFWDDFDGAVACMFDFLFGDLSSKNEMLAKAKQACKKETTTLQLKSTLPTYQECSQAINKDNDPVWHGVGEFRRWMSYRRNNGRYRRYYACATEKHTLATEKQDPANPEDEFNIVEAYDEDY